MVIAPLPFSHPEERTNLPVQLTSFVGRGPDIDKVRALLTQAHLVTLTGGGGIGKTRLALEVASRLMPEYEDGVWLVELAGLTDPELVPQTVLAALGFAGQPGRTPNESLISVLAGRQLLCVLDNCEHLVDAAAQIADALLKNCPELRILATNRDVLRIGGEVIYHVPSMTMPDKHRQYSLVDLQRYETVQLFLERADSARAGFRVTPDTAPSVARICQRLDGIPLAIELAAVRTRSMSITTIDEHLADQFRLLTGGSRVSMPRQRTLRATFDWSHDLLGDDEKRVFRRLSLFVGGFSLDAAQTVCLLNEIDTIETPVLGVLNSLVDKSLVMFREVAGSWGRYRILEPIRQYAYDRLKEVQETDAARENHAHFFLALGDDVYRELQGPGQIVWMPRAVEELDNFRACFGWALDHDPSSALKLAVALERYWESNSPAEGREWLIRALSSNGARDELRAHALCDAARWSVYTCDFDRARELAGECLTLAHELASDLFTGQALNALAVVETIECAEGWVARSLSLFERAEPHFRAAHDPEALGRLLNNYGSTLYQAGDATGARPKIEEALALARNRNDIFHIALFLLSLADLECEGGETAAAEAHYKQVLEIAHQLGSRTRAAYALASLARLAVDVEPERFLRLLGAASSLLKVAGILDVQTAHSGQEGQRASTPAFGEGVSDAIWREGAGIALTDAARSDLRRRTSRSPVGDEASDALWREGAGMSLTEAIEFGLGEAIQPAAASVAGSHSVGDAEALGECAFVREGGFWSLTYAGVIVRLKDSKGLRDIAHLLATPGRGIAAVDLASGPVRDAGRAGLTVTDLGLRVEIGAGDALDVEARAQYRRRIVDLEAEISEADANNDLERASRGRAEREFLISELGAAVGLGGRPRRLADPAERARKAVNWRIHEAITRIDKVHPLLGRHLRHSVRTGSHCVYDPAEPTTWRLTTESSGGRSVRSR